MDGKASARQRAGRRASMVGIGANILLFAAKLAAGTLAGSVSLAADAFNNLSDALNCGVSLLGFVLASRPADREHPYGHARYEYLAALVASALILAVGFEMLIRAMTRLLRPVATAWTELTVTAAIGSIAVKLALCLYDRRMAKKLDSGALRAAAVDSLSDAGATLAVLLGAGFSRLTGIQADGALGLGVAGLILLEGVSLLREAVSPLLGRAPEEGSAEALRSLIASAPDVLGVHDLMLHDYGPGHAFATAHVELPETVSAREGHNLLDGIERDALRRFGVNLTLHLDPVATEDGRFSRVRGIVGQALRAVDPRLTLHDLRVSEQGDGVLVQFDCIAPYDAHQDEAALAERLRQAIEDALGEGYRVEPTVEHSWTGGA